MLTLLYIHNFERCGFSKIYITGTAGAKYCLSATTKCKSPHNYKCLRIFSYKNQGAEFWFQ